MEKNSSNRNNKYYYDIVKHMVHILEERDSYTMHHSRRVAKTSLFVAESFGLSAVQCKRVYLAADAHDIGKIGIPDCILNKRGSLTEEEWVIMKRHPELGARILMKSPSMERIAEIVRCHHERYDGTGYPSGLAELQIPLEARIIAVCDSIDAMQSKRAYRDSLPDEMCRYEIDKNSGLMYDPQVVDFVLKNWEQIRQELKTTVS